MRHIVNQDSARSALGAVAAELGSGKAELVAQGPSQGFLFHYIGAARLAVDIQREQPVAAALTENARGAKQIGRRGNGHSAADHTSNKVPPRDPSRSDVGQRLDGFFAVSHTNSCRHGSRIKRATELRKIEREDLEELFSGIARRNFTPIFEQWGR